ncbi:villin-4-like protein [Tanacetum coccineum]
MELYPGEDQEECLIGTWFGSLSIKEDIISAASQTYKMVESQKFLAALVNRVFMKEGGLNDGYKNFISKKELPDGTCTEKEAALCKQSNLNIPLCILLVSHEKAWYFESKEPSGKVQALPRKEKSLLKTKDGRRFQ